MKKQYSNVTIVVRECGERTAEACVWLLQQTFPNHEIHRVSARPFSETLRRSLEKGVAEGRPWTLCIDADVLALPELTELLIEAENAPTDLFEIQGLVFDKLMMAPRAAGNHLYRTCLIPRALPLISDGNGLRPEAEMIKAMIDQGFNFLQSAVLVGLHDFEQFYCDLYAKAYLHGYKHRFLLPLYRPLWKWLARNDADYRVTLAALDESRSDHSTPSVSRDFRAEEANTATARLGLEEKPTLETAPDSTTIRNWIQQCSLSGEARALSGQIASTIQQGLFPRPREQSSPTYTASNSICPHVLIVCANVYPQFYFCAPLVGGGMETRAALFGRGLAARKRWHLGFVVSDFGQPFVTHHEGIDFHIYQPVYRRAGRNVFPRLRKRRWFPILNLDQDDLKLLWQIPLIAAWLALPAFFFPRFWKKLKPELVCCFGNNAQSAEVIADCHRTGIRTILCIASDKDISPDYRPDSREVNHNAMPKWKGHYSLTMADCIIVQSETQRAALLRHFNRDAVLIRNPVHVSPNDPQYWLPRGQREYGLWIGRSDDFNKRPMLYLELAKDCPDLEFLMIVSRTDEAVFLTLSSSCPANLRIVEHVPPQEIWDYLHRARVLVNTSRFEGFPNSFLQAAVMGVPIVSLEVDPDGMLSRHACGVCAVGDPGAMRQAVLELSTNAARADAFSANCHRYVLERHEAEQRIAELEACLDEQRRLSNAPARIPWWQKWRRFIGFPGAPGGKDVG